MGQQEVNLQGDFKEEGGVLGIKPEHLVGPIFLSCRSMFILKVNFVNI